MNNSRKCIMVVLMVVLASTAYSLPTPPDGKKWALMENLSDEFNNGFDDSKWHINTNSWKGRKPGLFKESQVSVLDGNLRITADVLPPSEQGDGWTHAGGLVGSVHPAKASFGGYYEARMKANKTFMSSTFWLINQKNQGQGCDVRTTELDITETVGFNSGGSSWINNMMTRMNSNLHSRNLTCAGTPDSIGGGEDLGEQSSANYHTYGAWWKSPTEIIFYLDGVEKYRVNPPAEFTLDMYLRMVVETYDWNPPPADGGMTGTLDDRTTFYDYVRSYQLVDEDTSPSEIPATLVPGRVEAEEFVGHYDTTEENLGSVYRNSSVDIQVNSDTNNGSQGHHIAWIEDGEWLEYPIMVTQAGAYTVNARVASPEPGAMFNVEISGEVQSNAVSIEATGGWDHWETYSVSLGYLDIGEKTLRVQVQTGGFNLNWLDLVGVSVDNSGQTNEGDNINEADNVNAGNVNTGNAGAKFTVGAGSYFSILMMLLAVRIRSSKRMVR